MDDYGLCCCLNKNTMPSASPVGVGAPAGLAGGLAAVPIVRLILLSPRGDGLYDTGATYPGCSRATPELCQGVQFATLEDAVSYAYAHNEFPVLAASEAEVWDVVEGRAQLDPARIIPAASPGLLGGNTLLYAGGTALLLFFLRRKKS